MNVAKIKNYLLVKKADLQHFCYLKRF